MRRKQTVSNIPPSGQHPLLFKECPSFSTRQAWWIITLLKGETQCPGYKGFI